MALRIDDEMKSLSFTCHGEVCCAYSSAGISSPNFLVKLVSSPLLEEDFSLFKSSSLSRRSSRCKLWFLAKVAWAFIVL